MLLGSYCCLRGLKQSRRQSRSGLKMLSDLRARCESHGSKEMHNKIVEVFDTAFAGEEANICER